MGETELSNLPQKVQRDLEMLKSSELSEVLQFFQTEIAKRFESKGISTAVIVNVKHRTGDGLILGSQLSTNEHDPNILFECIKESVESGGFGDVE